MLPTNLTSGIQRGMCEKQGTAIVRSFTFRRESLDWKFRLKDVEDKIPGRTRPRSRSREVTQRHFQSFPKKLSLKDPSEVDADLTAMLSQSLWISRKNSLAP